MSQCNQCRQVMCGRSRCQCGCGSCHDCCRAAKLGLAWQDGEYVQLSTPGQSEPREVLSRAATDLQRIAAELQNLLDTVWSNVEYPNL